MSRRLAFAPLRHPDTRVAARRALALALSLAAVTAACASSEPSAPVLGPEQVIVAQAGADVRLVRVLPERTSMDSISTAAYRIVLRVGATK